MGRSVKADVQVIGAETRIKLCGDGWAFLTMFDKIPNVCKVIHYMIKRM
jgi:hypothetical protein